MKGGLLVPILIHLWYGTAGIKPRPPSLNTDIPPLTYQGSQQFSAPSELLIKGGSFTEKIIIVIHTAFQCYQFYFLVAKNSLKMSEKTTDLKSYSKTYFSKLTSTILHVI